MTDLKEKDRLYKSPVVMADQLLSAKPGEASSEDIIELRDKLPHLPDDERQALLDEMNEQDCLDDFFQKVEGLNVFEKKGKALADKIIILEKKRNDLVVSQSALAPSGTKIEKGGVHRAQIRTHLVKAGELEAIDRELEPLRIDIEDNYHQIEELRTEIRTLYREQIFPLGKTVGKRNDILGRIKANCLDTVLREELLCDGLTFQLQQRKDNAIAAKEANLAAVDNFAEPTSLPKSAELESQPPTPDSQPDPVTPDLAIDSNIKIANEPVELAKTDETAPVVTSEVAKGVPTEETVIKSSNEGEASVDIKERPATESGTISSAESIPVVAPVADAPVSQSFVDRIKRLSSDGLFSAIRNMGRVNDTRNISAMEKHLIELRNVPEESIVKDLDNNLVGKN